VRITVVVHGWLPNLAAGSERAMLELCRALRDAGHTITVHALDERTGVREYEGMRVVGRPMPGVNLLTTPDLYLHHHGPAAGWVRHRMRSHGPVPHVTYLHNERYNITQILFSQPDMVIHNTYWVRKAITAEYGDEFTGPVLHPPLDYDRHHVDDHGDRVLLSNLQTNKGVELFAKLAAMCPEIPFLGLRGTHGEQDYYSEPNLINLPPVDDMRGIWRQTGVCLMLSEYESYGMIAAEACASGIPVLSVDHIPGPREALGNAAVYLPRHDTDAWAAELRRLKTDRDYYAARSVAALRRARFLGHRSQIELKTVVQQIEGLVP
jgi:glycosyltransferase involved in cell wall biosynthesis